MRIGYARCSSSDQKLDLQMDALRQARCEKIFTDVASGKKTERVGLQQALEHLRGGDILVVFRLDRLGRSLRHLIDTVMELKGRGVEFLSLQESIDTSTSGGKLVFHIFASIAEFERELIRERTKAGLASARARGRLGGRPQSLDRKQIALARSLYDSKKHTIGEICNSVGVSKPTLYRYLAQAV